MIMDEMTGKTIELEQKYKSAAHRLDKMEERQDNLEKLVTSVEVLATRQETVESDVKEIKSGVQALTEKPGKRWDGIVDKLVWAVLAAGLGFLLAQAGIG